MKRQQEMVSVLCDCPKPLEFSVAVLHTDCCYSDLTFMGPVLFKHSGRMKRQP